MLTITSRHRAHNDNPPLEPGESGTTLMMLARPSDHYLRHAPPFLQHHQQIEHMQLQQAVTNRVDAARASSAHHVEAVIETIMKEEFYVWTPSPEQISSCFGLITPTFHWFDSRPMA